MTKRSISLLLLMILIVVGLLCAGVFLKKQVGMAPSGRIIFQIGDALSLVDGDGNHVQFLGGMTGFSPTWSNDGKYIAVGCYDTNKICILDASTIPDWRSFPTSQVPYAPKTVQEIELPEACRIDVRDVKTIQSLSWSPNNEKLALACGNAGSTDDFSVCIVSLNNDSKCWNKELSRGVRHIVWSPIDDVLAVSGGDDIHGVDPEITASKIYLVTPDGERLRLLSEGWNPEWSPDGSQLAFFKWGDHENYPGIGIVSPDGNGFHWVYESPQRIGGPYQKDTLSFGCSDDGTYGCRLAWSPNGQFLVFAAQQNIITGVRLLRLDLETDEIIFLIPPGTYGGYYVEPDWGP